ncbi:MAG TPA: Hsp20/alpha crystallin family protein [Burkholderiaceae bacterium]|nr:Hsp20/alpha crystallin family protein [Burkholderiaceae bacterium]
MFFASTAPALQRRHVYSPAGRSLERFLGEALQTPRQQASSVEQDDKSVTLTFDVPGIAKDQLSIGIEGNIVRIQSREGAARRYSFAYELPQDIDVATSQAKLENGVLTLKLAKIVPVSQVTELAIN